MRFVYSQNCMRSSFIAIAFLSATLLLQIDQISVKDFKPAFGKWKGTLAYLDYKTGKPYTMPANITISKDENTDRYLLMGFEYPDEPKANNNDTLFFSNNGSQINGAPVTSKLRSKRMGLEIITEKPGIDGNDNRKATIKHIYIIGRKTFISRKEIRFDGEAKFILRSEYIMKR